MKTNITHLSDHQKSPSSTKQYDDPKIAVTYTHGAFRKQQLYLRNNNNSTKMANAAAKKAATGKNNVV